jgi:endonuclease/exonuclease/phosphatase family metal-dependent hydrolase
MRICSVNAEWMNDWFTPDDEPVAFRAQFRRDGVANDTAVTAGRLAAMLQAIDADVIAIQEGPSRAAELALFVDTYLDGAYQFFHGDTGGQQKLALLYRNVASATLIAPDDLVSEWEADVDGDAILDSYRFTRTPLVVDLVVGDQPLQLVVAHTKSNFINMGRELWDNPATRQAFIVEALTNRRRISAEGMRMRRYLDRRLAADPAVRIIVLGDLNDGPGLDYFEERYLTHNVTDIVVGSAFRPEWQFTHAQHDVPAARRYTAVFEDFIPTREVRRLLLDHILISPGLEPHRVPGSGAIRHAEYDAQVVDGGVRRQDRPCDHRPVTVDLR